MFNNFVQSLKEIGNPKVQDGQLIQNPAEFGTEKAVVLDQDGEITEEGFVSIGRSSFYSLNNEVYGPAAIGQSQSIYPPIPSTNLEESNNMAFPYGGAQYNPNPGNSRYNPYPIQNAHPPLQHAPSIEMADTVRNILTLHPDLRPHVGLYDPQMVNRRSISGQGSFNPAEFDYDFEFERGVLRDISRQFH